ncbi:MAG: DUF3168 domain-containing protein [Acidimicrobiia bacterium]
MGSPAFPIQTAIYVLLDADLDESGAGTLDDLGVVGVFDEVPEGTNKPYVVVGEAYETPDNSHDRKGRRTVVTVHVWSDQQGFKESVEIADRIVDLLDHTPLTIAGWTHIATRFDFMQTLRDPDPDIRHVPIRFVVTAEETI